jgi:glycosyltransferase involved in cell wall biosynthesis
VPPEEIVKRISMFDVGLHFIPPSSYNNLVCLPNKFFDFIAAGLAVCIGPSPSMTEIVEKYGLGCISPSFEPAQIAATLNQTSADQWNRMREAARKASEALNAQQEMTKLVSLYEGLFAEEQSSNI